MFVLKVVVAFVVVPMALPMSFEDHQMPYALRRAIRKKIKTSPLESQIFTEKDPTTGKRTRYIVLKQDFYNVEESEGREEGGNSGRGYYQGFANGQSPGMGYYRKSGPHQTSYMSYPAGVRNAAFPANYNNHQLKAMHRHPNQNYYRPETRTTYGYRVKPYMYSEKYPTSQQPEDYADYQIKYGTPYSSGHYNDEIPEEEVPQMNRSPGREESVRSFEIPMESEYRPKPIRKHPSGMNPTSFVTIADQTNFPEYEENVRSTMPDLPRHSTAIPKSFQIGPYGSPEQQYDEINYTPTDEDVPNEGRSDKLINGLRPRFNKMKPLYVKHVKNEEPYEENDEPRMEYESNEYVPLDTYTDDVYTDFTPSTKQNHFGTTSKPKHFFTVTPPKLSYQTNGYQPPKTQAHYTIMAPKRKMYTVPHPSRKPKPVHHTFITRKPIRGKPILFKTPNGKYMVQIKGQQPWPVPEGISPTVMTNLIDQVQPDRLQPLVNDLIRLSKKPFNAFDNLKLAMTNTIPITTVASTINALHPRKKEENKPWPLMCTSDAMKAILDALDATLENVGSDGCPLKALIKKMFDALKQHFNYYT